MYIFIYLFIFSLVVLQVCPLRIMQLQTLPLYFKNVFLNLNNIYCFTLHLIKLGIKIRMDLMTWRGVG